MLSALGESCVQCASLRRARGFNCRDRKQLMSVGYVCISHVDTDMMTAIMGCCWAIQRCSWCFLIISTPLMFRFSLKVRLVWKGVSETDVSIGNMQPIPKERESASNYPNKCDKCDWNWDKMTWLIRNSECKSKSLPDTLILVQIISPTYLCLPKTIVENHFSPKTNIQKSNFRFRNHSIQPISSHDQNHQRKQNGCQCHAIPHQITTAMPILKSHTLFATIQISG